MKILGIEHIGIAVDNLKKNAPFWNKILDIKYSKTENVTEQGVITDIYDTGKGKIELLVSKSPNSPIARFIKKRGPGIHHICLQVENIAEAMKVLNENNIKIIGKGVSIGAEGYKIIFIHPDSTGGVLVELAEKDNRS